MGHKGAGGVPTSLKCNLLQPAKSTKPLGSDSKGTLIQLYCGSLSFLTVCVENPYNVSKENIQIERCRNEFVVFLDK